ncbi:hypothetical protein H0A61_00036 [Koleobacter methoxysyntrophicus]|jgi:hypothetical protein|uniref:SHOCT-like domain-containing protein n=1 Tax=Koleobacter methoxysyntrophicus TaxID=2751313 RepID=A0A8A0RJA5_9FIRM|nr:SHOCT domain-containing protein [Koleobacter methoxysyntrophicus]QSQ07720.1 hypothetical protein H0A61_00036 [Koleobacter methoxysyntrophicus]
MTGKGQSIEYLLSRHLLKKLLKEVFITEEEFIKIDAENRKTFVGISQALY